MRDFTQFFQKFVLLAIRMGCSKVVVDFVVVLSGQSLFNYFVFVSLLVVLRVV